MTTPENVLAKRIPADYAAAAVIAQKAAEHMLARLEFMTLQPQVIVDAGCNVGYNTHLLSARYPNAQIIASDASLAMLDYAQQQKIAVNWLHTPTAVLPLAARSVDLITANLFLPWCSQLDAVLREWRRVLRPDGLLMLTSFGPDTLQELPNAAVPILLDMHNIGDELVQAGLADPVLDVEHYTLTYRDSTQLLQELHATSMIAPDADVTPISDAQGIFPVTYEVVYGHAWGADVQTADEDGVVKIPISQIGRHR